MTSEYLRFLEIAIKASKRAAIVLSEPSALVVDLEQDRDLKIQGDKLAEREILKILESETGFSSLSEEYGWTSKSDPGAYHWIVDPLDGTVNFFRTLPVYCTSIALWKGDKPVLGVIRDLVRDDVYSGVVGNGAWLNGQPMRVSEVAKKDKAILCTGFPVAGDFSSERITNFVKDAQSFKKVRMFGSAAMSMAFVASGKADAYAEFGAQIWDVAAGVALVQAAGGKVEISKAGDRETVLNVLANNGKF